MSSSKQSKQELAYSSIKQSIINNEFLPDTPLTENFLCQKYNLSRTPVREALQRLTSDGFVSFIKDKGAFVAQIGLEDLLQNYEVREALEGMAARLCAKRVTPAILNELKNLLENSTAYYHKGDFAKAMSYDMQFHRFMIAAAKNPKLERMMDVTMDLISCVAYNADSEIISRSLEDHQKIIKALEAPDADLAESLAREHVKHSKKYHFDKYYMTD